MKKTTKTITSILLSVIMAVTLCACAGNGQKSADSKMAVESFLNDLKAFEMEKAQGYIDKDGENPFESIPFKNIEDMKKMAVSEIEMPEGMEGIKDMMSDFFGNVLKSVSNNITYDIGERKEENGVHIYNVKMQVTDFNKMDDLESLVGKEVYAEIMGELMKVSGGNDESETEVYKNVYTSLLGKLNEVVEVAVSNCEKKEMEMSITVVNKDGKWLISGDRLRGINEMFGGLELPGY